MNLLSNYKQVAFVTFLSGVSAAACLLLAAIGADYHFEVFNNPSLLLTLPGVNATASKWSMICDMLGYYLLLLPVVYYFHAWMSTKTAWSAVITFCGLAYILIGAIGAAVLAVVYPQSIATYSTASPAMQPLIRSGFELTNTIIYSGLWNLLEVLFAAIWWLAIGALLLRERNMLPGIVSAAAGLFSLLDGMAGMLGLAPLHELALNGYLYTAIIWAFYFSFLLRKNKFANRPKAQESLFTQIPPPHYQKMVV